MPGSQVTDGSLSPPLDGGSEFEFEFPKGNDHDDEGDDDETLKPIDYSSFGAGFSDDEGDNGIAALTAAAVAGKPRRRIKVSPRRAFVSDDESEPEPSPKRPRKSMFSGSDTSPEPEDDIRSRLDSINLDGEDTGVQNSQIQHYGFQPIRPSAAASRSSPCPSDESDNIDIPDDTVPAYNLRTQRPKLRTTYLDQDNSGNFDPALEAKQASVRLQHVKALKIARKKGKETGKGRGRKAKEAVKEPCDCGEGKYLLRLKIENTAQLRVNTDDQSNCPAGYEPPCEECEAEQNAYRRFYKVPIEDPAGELPDLTGHLEARGCRYCRQDGTEEGKPCTLIHGGNWPCVQCENKGEVCEPIIAPIEQGRCKRCHENDRDDCSFETEPGQAVCDNCFDNEFECEPLPPVGYKTARISMDQILYGPDRPAIRCAKCFVNNKRCSLKSKNDKPPCNQCMRAGIGCIFIDEKTLAPLKKKKAANKNAPIFSNGQSYVPEVSVPSADLFTAEELAEFEESSDEEIERAQTPEMFMQDADGNQGMTTKITTSFAHPIQFCSLIDDSVAVDCNFCQSPGFPFVGHEEREVYVMKWETGLGYSELGGGHVEQKGPTIMCRDCVLIRVQIFNCEDHQLVALPGNIADADLDELTARLLEASGGEATREELKKWCSFCFMPAVFLCGTVQPALLPSNLEVEEIHGCGLRLCASCEFVLKSSDMGGDVSKMAADINLLPKALGGEEELVGKVRADVGFLAEGGLLMKNVIHEMGHV